MKGLLKALGKRSSDVEIVFVAPSDGFFHAIAAPRSLANAGFAERSFTPYSSCWSQGAVRHVQAVATKLLPSSIELSTGEVVAFDVAVLATGRTYASPFRFAPGETTADRLERLSQMRDQIKRATEVVVVGGGSSGVETAAEIKSAFADKKVVLVHSKGQLLNTQHQVTPKHASALLSKLQALGVEVQLDRTFAEADVPENSFVIWANKSTPNTQWISELVDKNGLVHADPFLRLHNAKNVFVAGDIVAGFVPNFKTAKMLHAPVVVSNVLSVIQGKEPKKQVGKLPGFLDDFLLLALGENQSFSVSLLGKMLESSKRKDYMLERQIAEMTK